jgi:hypothetical protein
MQSTTKKLGEIFISRGEIGVGLLLIVIVAIAFSKAVCIATTINIHQSGNRPNLSFY